MFHSKISPRETREENTTMTQPEPAQPKKQSLRKKSSRRKSKASLPRQSSNAPSITFGEDLQQGRYMTAQGEISFWKNFAYETPGRPYIRVTHDINMEDVAHVMINNWDIGHPRIVLVMISNVVSLGGWKNTRQLDNFKKGLIKAANTTDMWILTHGANIGIVKVIGDAVQEELLRRQALRCHKHPHQTNIRLPKLRLIGIARDDLISYSEMLDGRTSRVEIENEGNNPDEGTFELNADHSHYIVVKDNTVNKTGINYFLLRLEQYLVAASEAQISSETAVDGTSQEQCPLGGVEIPVVSILVQGGYNCARLVLEHLKKKLPVIVIRGSGGLADLLAYAYYEVEQRPYGIMDAEYVENFLKPELSTKIAYEFPMFCDNNLARNMFRDRIMECVRHVHQDGRIYLTILNLHSHTCNLQNLDEHILRALFKCHRSDKSDQTSWQARMQKDLYLTLDWNSPHVAMSEVFQKDTCHNFQISKAVFEQALHQSNREDFISLFLEQGFQVHKYLTPRRLKNLFRIAQREEFFRSICWEAVLGHGGLTKLSKNFIDGDLNWLLHKMTGIPNFVNGQELSLNAMGMYPTEPSSAERKALAILTLWAVLTKRTKLAKLLWKNSDQPIHLALIISMVYNRLILYISETITKTEMEDLSKEFAEMATGVLDASYKEATCRTYDVLCEESQDWSYRTAVDIAADAKNRTFLSHPSCQKWLTNMFLGNIRMRDLTWGPITIPVWLKVILSAFLVVPMYIWVRFKSDPIMSDDDDESDGDSDDEKDERDGDEDILIHQNDVGNEHVKLRTGNAETSVNAKGNSPIPIKQFDTDLFIYYRPNIFRMIYLMWSAPITKFWTFQTFYIIYLGIFSLAVMWPSCGNWYLDVAVCSWTTLILVEIIHRTYVLYKKYTSIPLYRKCAEILLIIIFILLYIFSRIVKIGLFLDPYNGRVLLCCGLLYFYYRIIAIYLPISPTLGPLLYRVKLMVLEDFVNFMRMVLLIIISGGIVIHAVLYPDYPLSVELFRRTFHKAWFSLFLTPIDDLQVKKECLSKRWENDADECIAGSYKEITCPNVGLWPYIFSIQYFVLLKLIMMTLLYALFSATASKLQTEVDAIWKFQRYQLVVDFAACLRLPAPLNVFSYILIVGRWLVKCSTCRLCRRTDEIDSPLIAPQTKGQRLSEKDYNYWRQLAQDYSKKQQEKELESNMLKKQTEIIGTITEDVDYQKRILRQLKGRLGELERMMAHSHVSLENIKHLAKKDKEKGILSQPVHMLSRHSPYPGTMVQRFPVPDKYVPWEVMWIDYDPVAFTRPKEDFVSNLRSHVDLDILYHREKYGEDNLPVFSWNSISISPAGVGIDRQSWMRTEDGIPLTYKLDSESVPQNPRGRTGLRGKGSLPRWGPNHYMIVIITRWQKSKYTIFGGKGMEFVVMRTERHDHITLPGGFVPNENRYEVVRSLFKSDKAPEVWRDREAMISFFSKCDVSTSEEDEKNVKCELIMLGYMDDPWNTDQGWREVELWHIHYNGQETIQENLQPTLWWRAITDDVFIKLPAGQASFLQEVTQHLETSIL